MIFGPLQRAYNGFISPPRAKKQDDAIRFGLLGASNIAPISLIAPAKGHPEAIIAAVAARDRTRAEAYAKKHQIPIIHSTYQDILDDPSIDAIYIALPNGLHYEWALRCLKAGKHVLLEKPSCSNATEATDLFNHPLVKAPGAPILLEAFHYRFHPAWQTFLSLIHYDPVAGPVRHAFSQQYMIKGGFPNDDIRFDFSLAGGCLMDFGTYNLSCLRQILREEPVEVLAAEYRGMPRSKSWEALGQEQVDQAMKATYRTESGATGTLVADIAASGGYRFLPAVLGDLLPSFGWPKCEAELAEKVISVKDGESHAVTRKVTMWNHLAPSIYHRIDVEDVNVVRRDGRVVKTWTETKHVKAYTWPSDDDRAGTGEEWWTTYGHQLNQFVNEIKGRRGTGVWVDGDDSVKQMEAIDRTYLKAGLQVRPTSSFQI